MTWTPTGAGSYIKFSDAVDGEKANLIDSAKSGTPTFASGDATVPIDAGAVITNLFRNTTAATFYDGSVTAVDVVDAAGIQGGDYLKGDGSSMYGSFPVLTLAAGETIAFDFLPEAGQNIEAADHTSSGFVLWWQNGLNNYAPTNCSILVDGADGKGQTIATGVVHEVVATVDSGTLKTSRVWRNSGLVYTQGFIANMVITQAAGTTIYLMDNAVDNGDGTATVPNTGTNTSQADMTIYNFVAATDSVTVANNTFSYDLSEGSGTTLGSTPSGTNISLVNAPAWS